MTVINLRPSLPHHIVITFSGGRAERLDIKQWMDTQPRLKHPHAFSEGHFSSGGIEWSCGPMLEGSKIEKLLAAKAKARS